MADPQSAKKKPVYTGRAKRKRGFLSYKAGYGRENGQEKGWLGKIEPEPFRPIGDTVGTSCAVSVGVGRAAGIKQECNDEISIPAPVDTDERNTDLKLLDFFVSKYHLFRPVENRINRSDSNVYRRFKKCKNAWKSVPEGQGEE